MAFFEDIDPSSDLSEAGFTATLTLTGGDWGSSDNGAVTVTLTCSAAQRQASVGGPVADFNELPPSTVVEMISSLKSYFGDFPTGLSSGGPDLSWQDVEITQTGYRRGSYPSE